MSERLNLAHTAREIDLVVIEKTNINIFQDQEEIAKRSR